YTWHNAVRQLPFSWKTAKPRHFLWIARQRSVIGHSREHVSAALESSGSVLYITTSDALHCTW
ncbi:unnamed protein product, partial [Staurois parvus]